jgi:hypothetical protein
VPGESSAGAENICPNRKPEGNRTPCGSTGSWTRSLDHLPPFRYEFIQEHLVEKSETMPDNRPTGAYRHKKMGYRLFKENYVNKFRVKPNIQSGKNKLFLVKSLVCASMKNQVYTVYVHLLQDEGNVLKANCSCKAGAGGCCKHVAATLFQIHDFVELGLSTVPDDKSCTDVLQQWNVPKNSNVSDVLLFTDLTFEKSNYESDTTKKRKRPIVSASRDYCATPCTEREITVERIQELRKGLSGSNTQLEVLLNDSDCKPCTSFATSLATQREKELTVETVDPKQEVFDSLSEEVMWKCVDESHHKFVTDILCLSKEDARKIEKETMGQSTSKKWFIERKKRLTSSNFGSVIKRKMKIYPKTILKRVLGSQRASHPACLWGIENEPRAKEKYSDKNPNATLYDFGLVINPQWPWLACSPDGICLSDGKWHGIEVKCPFSKKDITVEEACFDKTFCLKLHGGKPTLKKNHDYFFQCQGVMALCQLPFLDFIVYTQVDTFVERIHFDKELWEECMLPKLSDFYFTFMMPEI